ncbi:hypothetical protein OESDEN_13205 [Oesophagostomum dentatum]|uniref:Uncharacterized protein n=1 Tax=Oesophagostomum dentatum TaxID=61180 RepID=A0A0B1SQ08_OESDE|nr:hypothetical protein OESDEN_13205 [Oesophagostomum dentatum]
MSSSNSAQSYGVYCDDDKKLHFYNCAPVKQKKKNLRPAENPVKRLFNKMFQRQDSAGATSGSELSLASDTKK